MRIATKQTIRILSVGMKITAPFNIKHEDSRIQSSTERWVFRYHQSNVRRLLRSSDYCRARGNQIAEYSSYNDKVLGSSRNL